MTRKHNRYGTAPSMRRRARDQFINDYLPAIMLASIAAGTGVAWLLTYTGVIL